MDSPSPASSSSFSSDDKQQSPSQLPASPIAPPNASASVLVTGSAIIEAPVGSSPDLVVLPLGSLPPQIPSENASALVLVTGSAITEAIVAASAVQGQISAEDTTRVGVVSDPVNLSTENRAAGGAQVSATEAAKLVASESPQVSTAAPGDSWADLFKGSAKPLSKKAQAFMLPSGEPCVKILNSIIEKNQKA